MIINPLAGIAALECVIEAARVLCESKASVQVLRQVVGQIAMSRYIQDAQIGFILASLANAVCHQRAIVRNVKFRDARGVLTTQRMSIEQQLVGTTGHPATVERPQVLLCSALGEVVVTVSLRRSPRFIVTQHFGKPLLDFCAYR
jgi:hypothetical protein